MKAREPVCECAKTRRWPFPRPFPAKKNHVRSFYVSRKLEIGTTAWAKSDREESRATIETSERLWTMNGRSGSDVLIFFEKRMVWKSNHLFCVCKKFFWPNGHYFGRSEPDPSDVNALHGPCKEIKLRYALLAMSQNVRNSVQSWKSWRYPVS